MPFKHLTLALFVFLLAEANCRYVEDAVDNSRTKREVDGTKNMDGSVDLNAKLPLTADEHKQLSAIISGKGLIPSYKSVEGGLLFENEKGHSLSGTGTHIPGYGDQLTAAAKFNIFQNDKHKFDVNAYVRKNMPQLSNVPNHNTYGGSMDYTYKDTFGASLGMSLSDLMALKEYNAKTNLNLFRNPSSSLDLYTGLSKSISPYMPEQSWEPSIGLTFKKEW